MNFINSLLENNTETIPFDFPEILFNNNSMDTDDSVISSEVEINHKNKSEQVEYDMNSAFDFASFIKVKDSKNILSDIFPIFAFLLIGLRSNDINLVLSKFKKSEQLSTLVIGLLKIKEKCGNIDDYTLEIPNDPEEGDEDGIFLTVYSNLSVERTMAIVDEIDNEWHLHQSEQFRNLFNYDISYK